MQVSEQADLSSAARKHPGASPAHRPQHVHQESALEGWLTRYNTGGTAFLPPRSQPLARFSTVFHKGAPRTARTRDWGEGERRKPGEPPAPAPAPPPPAGARPQAARGCGRGTGGGGGMGGECPAARGRAEGGGRGKGAAGQAPERAWAAPGPEIRAPGRGRRARRGRREARRPRRGGPGRRWASGAAAGQVTS